MGFWSRFKNSATPSSSLDEASITVLDDFQERVKLKNFALEVCASWVARTLSGHEVRILKNKERQYNYWFYKLNFRPNRNESATTFWERAIKSLFMTGETLIVMTDTDDFLVADSYIRNEKALYDDVFSSVVVKDYTFVRSFQRKDVIFLELPDCKLKAFINELWNDYGKLLARMFEIQMRNGQVRAKVNMKLDNQLDADVAKGKRKHFRDNVMNAIRHSPVALIPTDERNNYEELTNNSKVAQQSFDEIKKLKEQSISEVAQMIGITPALVLGQAVDNEKNQAVTYENVIEPLLSKINDELTTTIFTQAEITHQEARVRFLRPKSLLENAEKIDKVGSSGVFTINEVREDVDRDPIADGDRIIMTKNYQEKGSEE